jgi:hypothetical protein
VSTTTRRQYGDRRACDRCGSDIEWHGRAHGWRDRGGARLCSDSGQARTLDNGTTISYPVRPHTVSAASERAL